MKTGIRAGAWMMVLACLILTVSCDALPHPTTPTAPPTAAPTAVPTTTVSQPIATTATTASTASEQPPQLTAWLAQHHVTYADLEERGCTQLVVTEYTGVRFFECCDRVWSERQEMTTCGFVGKHGVTSDKTEGDGCTPRGLYAVGEAFYRDTLPETGLPIFHITDETYWVDDPDSRFYNQRVEGTAQKDWQSAEHMADYECYRYGFTVQYNVPAVKGAGSAIFFHIGSAPTLGCIAVSEEMVLAYLEELDAAAHPHVLIV